MADNNKVAVLFVCTGNICRSPTAEGIFLKLVADAGLGRVIRGDSAGTHGYHVGAAPDPRAQAAAARRGYDLSKLRARRFEASDFERFDLILPMDEDHWRFIKRLAPQGAAERMQMMMSYAQRHRVAEVPDPYYGGPDGFEQVLDLLEDAIEGLVDTLRARV